MKMRLNRLAQAVFLFVLLATSNTTLGKDKPNILWIVVEDASPHIGCYGETAIKTPNLDRLAAEGVRFENASVTCPVCSPGRSALATGMYQTTIGAHNHRSCRLLGKGGGNSDYYASYQLPDATPPVSHMFKQAGYYTCNGAGPSADKKGKTDYNFVSFNTYDGADWKNADDKPFFAQIQLKGGKSRPKGFQGGTFELPPYYPDDAVFRKDWGTYLNSWIQVDQEVGQIIESLKQAGVYENTLIAFITDHGVSHLRGKQFVYEEGVRIPMILRFPGKKYAGTVRNDLAIHIDLAPISLAYADVAIPPHLQGKDLFAKDYEPREMTFTARDRCDETLDILRSVRTQRYKYIRNFLSYRPHLQMNQYKDGKVVTKQMRSLHKAGKLNELQSRIFTIPRPTEELYDLEADPYETKNLAGSDQHKAILSKLRSALYQWMVESGDPGLIAEPILEDLGKKHGNKLAAMTQPGMEELFRRLVAVIEAGERKDLDVVRKSLTAADPAERYWAATWAGVNKDSKSVEALQILATDPVATVRVAACLSLCQLGQEDAYFSTLVQLIEDPNLIVGMYAMNAIEQSGVRNQLASQAADIAQESKYDFTRRYGKRLAELID